MFCKKCGQQIDDGSVFCKLCGASQTETAPEPPAAETVPTAKKKGNAKKIWGIVLLVLGVCALLGGLANGSLAETFSAKAGIEDLARLFLQIALIAGGGYLLYSHATTK